MPTESKTAGYAKAIFEIARSEAEMDRVSDELFRIARALEKEHEWRQALTDIAIPDDKKEVLLADVLGDKVSPHTLNVLNFVVRQGRSRELVEIADELARLAEEESKREIAEVRTAVDLDSGQVKRLEEALSTATGKNVTVKVVVDPSVVGGVVAKVGDVVIDGSIRHKLDLLKSRLGAH